MAIASRLSSTKWKVHFGADCRSVDVSNSGIQVAHGSKGFVDIASVDRRRQTVLDVVGNLDRVFEIFTRDDRDHWSENFFLSDAHLGIDVAEDGWLHKKAMMVVAFVQAVTTALQLRTFGFAYVDILQVALQLALVNCRSHVGSFVKTIADPKFFRALNQAADELAIDAFLRNDSAGRGAALAGCAKGSPERALDCQIQIRVIEHDHGILAAQFQRTMLKT